MNIECFTGVLDSNVYCIWNENSSDAVIIDAGAELPQILKVLNTYELSLKYIILTHNHFDHIYYVKEIKNATGAKVVIHKEDALGLNNPSHNHSSLFGEPIAFNQVDNPLLDRDVIKVDNLNFEIIHTPGHTTGCISIKVNEHLFTGDTLFKGSIGRTDFFNSNSSAIYSSIQHKLFTLPKDTIVYPGHGPSTTIGYEIKNNFVTQYFGK